MILGREVVLLSLLLLVLALAGCGGGGGSSLSDNISVESPTIPSDVNDSLSSIDSILDDLGL